jgi:hypothetical protein
MQQWDINLENKSQKLKCKEQQISCVMFVTCTTLHKLNPQKLFNLFCIYGNITQIRFTFNENIALVQMESKSQVECTIKHLQNSKIYGKDMLLKISEHGDEIKSKPIACPLDNGSRREEMFSPNFRRFLPDYKIIRRSNSLGLLVLKPVKLTPEFIFNVVSNTLGHSNVLVDMRTSQIFILTFKSVEDAIQALILCNNMSVVDPTTSGQFYLKLRFYEP